MADTDRIKRNLSKMIGQGAPEADLNSYLKTEGFNSPDEWRSAVTAPTETEGQQDYVPQGYTGGEKAARVVGQAATGFNDAVANTVGAPVDAAAWALRQAGVSANNPVGGSASIKRGIDYVATLPGRVGDAVSQGSFAPLTDDRMSRFNAIGTTEKFAHGAGEGVGNALSIAVPAAAIANTARAGTVTQGVANALATQPVTQAVSGAVGGGVGEATDNPWLGLAAGAAVPVAAAAARGVISPLTQRLTPQEQRLVQVADAEGIPLTPGQRTGSKGAQVVESVFANTPGASGPMQNTLRNQREQFNRAALERAGVTATDASPDTINRAFRTAGQTFDDLANRTTLSVDRQFVNDVRQVESEYGRRLPTDVAPVFQSYMNDLEPALSAATTGQNPQIAGDIYARIRSGIGRRIRAASGRPDLQEALGGLQTALDDAVERSTSGPLRQEWQDARRQYQALMTIDKAMRGGTQGDRAAANIPFNALRQATVQGDRAGFSRGRGQMNELARVGDFIADRIPNSGTASRQMVLNPLEWPGLIGGGIASRAYNTGVGQRYLTNQLAGQTDFRGLYTGQLARQGREEIEGGQNALSRRGGR